MRALLFGALSILAFIVGIFVAVVLADLGFSAHEVSWVFEEIL